VQWAGGSAATIAVVTFLVTKVIRPTLRGLRRLGELLDRLLELISDWPRMQADVIAQAGELTALAIQVGELKGKQDKEISEVRRDLNELWRRYRRERGEVLPSSRGGGTDG
jgi:hypothetical protein